MIALFYLQSGVHFFDAQAELVSNKVEAAKIVIIFSVPASYLRFMSPK